MLPDLRAIAAQIGDENLSEESINAVLSLRTNEEILETARNTTPAERVAWLEEGILLLREAANRREEALKNQPEN